MTARASALGLRRAAGRGGTGDARPKIGDHAVVLGASMSGLLAARVLADAYQQVTVVERDVLADSGMPRKGVPQGRHARASSMTCSRASWPVGFHNLVTASDLHRLGWAGAVMRPVRTRGSARRGPRDVVFSLPSGRWSWPW
jgi:hypothetical protein